MGVNGIGGLFFRARDPDALKQWYCEHLGVGCGDWGVWDQQAGTTVFFPSFSNSQEIFSGGPCGGNHLFAASENFAGSPGSSPSISIARWIFEGWAFVRSTDSCSLVPFTTQKNSSGALQSICSQSMRICRAGTLM